MSSPICTIAVRTRNVPTLEVALLLFLMTCASPHRCGHNLERSERAWLSLWVATHNGVHTENVAGGAGGCNGVLTFQKSRGGKSSPREGEGPPEMQPCWPSRGMGSTLTSSSFKHSSHEIGRIPSNSCGWKHAVVQNMLTDIYFFFLHWCPMFPQREGPKIMTRSKHFKDVSPHNWSCESKLHSLKHHSFEENVS